MALYPLFKPLFFCLDAETAHRAVTGGVRVAARVPGFLSLTRLAYGYRHPALRLRLWERDFPNPLGLAAGFDKDARLVEPLLALGFGFVEVGTVTPRAQPGNPRPRLFRLPAQRALINRMGFNSRGALQLAYRLERRAGRSGIVGVNLGKNLDTALEDAASDYLTCLHAVYANASYVVVNLSSPNTPGLRRLQEKSLLAELARLLVRERDKLVGATGRTLPFLIKIAPDLSEGELADVVEVAGDAGMDGIVATNTTIRRSGLHGRHSTEQGGLSGRPLRHEALRTISLLHRLSDGKIPLVGVGGVASADDAYALIRAGASLVQVYTGLVYGGPRLVTRIKRGLVRRLRRDGFTSIGEAVGSAPPKR